MKNLAKLSIAGAVPACSLLVLTVLNHNPNAAVPVQGWVLADGMPVVGASIFLIPENLKTDGSKKLELPLPATTDSFGRYALPDGAPPGNYRVLVKGFINEGSPGRILAMGDEALDEGQLTAAAMARTSSPSSKQGSMASRQPVPPQYSSAEETVLRLVVPDRGLNNAEINLTLPQMALNSTETRNR